MFKCNKINKVTKKKSPNNYWFCFLPTWIHKIHFKYWKQLSIKLLCVSLLKNISLFVLLNFGSTWIKQSMLFLYSIPCMSIFWVQLLSIQILLIIASKNCSTSWSNSLPLRRYNGSKIKCCVLLFLLLFITLIIEIKNSFWKRKMVWNEYRYLYLYNFSSVTKSKC